MVEFYLLRLSRFPLPNPEKKILIFTRIKLTTSALVIIVIYESTTFITVCTGDEWYFSSTDCMLTD